MSISASQLPIIEPRMIEDDFAEGLLRVESAGGGSCMQLVFYNIYEDGDGRRYRCIIRKIVVPVATHPNRAKALFAEFLLRRKSEGPSNNITVEQPALISADKLDLV